MTSYIFCFWDSCSTRDETPKGRASAALRQLLPRRFPEHHFEFIDTSPQIRARQARYGRARRPISETAFTCKHKLRREKARGKRRGSVRSPTLKGEKGELRPWPGWRRATQEWSRCRGRATYRRPHPSNRNADVPPTTPKPLAFLSRALIACTALAALLVTATFWLGARAQTEGDWVRHTLAVRGQMGETMILIQRVETSQRGYLLTGRDVYLAPYDTAAAELPRSLDKLAELVASGSAGQPEELEPRDKGRLGRLSNPMGRNVSEA
jgi:CHASE3 domain-containing protein